MGVVEGRVANGDVGTCRACENEGHDRRDELGQVKGWIMLLCFEAARGGAEADLEAQRGRGSESECIEANVGRYEGGMSWTVGSVKQASSLIQRIPTES